MQRMFYLFLLFIGITFSVLGQSTKVMTYNIRYDNPNDGVNKWDLRKNYLTSQIKFYEPDFIGMQEALLHQLTFIDSSLSRYNYIGVGRSNGKVDGEFSPLFFNAEKFQLLKSSTFWLSETPDIPSKGWDAALNRICTYGLFKNLKSGNKIWILNTHFDHRGIEARKKSVKLIIQKIEELNKDQYPVVLMGDLNLEPKEDAIKFLSKKMIDTKGISGIESFGPLGTFNGFNFHEPVTRRIDYIFVSETGIEVEKYAVLSDSKDCKYPSDHLPVFVELIMTNM